MDLWYKFIVSKDIFKDKTYKILVSNNKFINTYIIYKTVK